MFHRDLGGNEAQSIHAVDMVTSVAGVLRGVHASSPATTI
jgi:hypothetical protein